MKLSYPHFEKRTINKVKQVLRSGRVNYWTGKECNGFEIFKIYRNKYSVTLSNGSVTLNLL